MKLIKLTLVLVSCLAVAFSACKKNDNIIPTPLEGGTATFTLGGTPSSCTGFELSSEDYIVGTPLTAANTVSFDVNVIKAGTYTITTNTVNGISFSGTGKFTSIGSQKVIITGTGIPLSAGSNDFTITVGENSCTFPLMVTITGTAYLTFEINGITKTYTNNAYATYEPTPSGTKLRIGAFMDSVSSLERISFSIYKFSNESILAGSYSVNGPRPLYEVYGIYTDASLESWSSTSGSTTLFDLPFGIALSSITATRVQGSFFGELRNNLGAGPGFVPIRGGSFYLPIK